MGRLFLLTLFILAALLNYSGVSFAQAPYYLVDVQHEISVNHTNILIASNEKIGFIYHELENPYRIIIDLIGVVFCELQEEIEIAEGPIKSIKIVKEAFASKPEGLDDYFYPVDYIVLEPREKYPFSIFYSKDSKVIIAQIKAEASLQDLIQQREGQVRRVVGPIPTIIQDVEYELNTFSSLVAIGSNKDIKPAIYEQFNPYRITIVPFAEVFCELEQKFEPMDGVVKSITINKDMSSKKAIAHDKYFYPVKNITIELSKQVPFTSHIIDEGKIMIVRLQRDRPNEIKVDKPKEEEKSDPDVKQRISKVESAAKPKKEEIAQEPKELNRLNEPNRPKDPIQIVEKKLFTPDERDNIVDEITKRLYLKQKKIFELKDKEEKRKRIIREARDKAKAIREVEKIGMEELAGLVSYGEETTTLEYCQDLGLSYSEPAAIAEEEISLAGMKVIETLRALFPSAKLKGTRTTGDVLGTDFIEEIYGVEAEYPIYQGGRLWNAYHQSKANLNLSKARYDKVVNDEIYKVSEAYYNAVTTVMNMRLNTKLLETTKHILETAEKRHAVGLSTDLEYFNVKSKHNQVQFQLASAERDHALARFKLEQAIGLDIMEETAELGKVETDLKFEIVNINLNKCLEIAQEYHPDIIVNELLVESNEFEEKIAKAKNDFKVDITGFLGRSDSRFETEPRDRARDWNIGIKVSRPFWGNTASYSFTKEETKIRVGQTDRQGTVTQEGEIAILDALGSRSGIKEAHIKMRKAENDLIESRRQVNLEVKEAYYNYQEAIIQVKNALEKIRFRKEAVKTAKMQAQLNEALQSQHIESEITLADERSVYIKALSDFNFSFVRLNKAVGIDDYFSIERKGEYNGGEKTQG